MEPCTAPIILRSFSPLRLRYNPALPVLALGEETPLTLGFEAIAGQRAFAIQGRYRVVALDGLGYELEYAGPATGATDADTSSLS